MKKNILIALTLFACMNAKAWEIGDFYIGADSIPSMVVYVDSTGEHGLRMSPFALSDTCLIIIEHIYNEKIFAAEGNIELKKQMEDGQIPPKRMKLLNNKIVADIRDSVIYEYEHTHDAADYTLDFIKKLPRQIHHTEWTPLKKKQWEQMISQVDNGAYGENNTKEIIRYCNENNINLERTFPAVYYATLLGENWFVPGTHELELVAKILTKGVGQYAEQKKEFAPLLSAYNKKIGYLNIFFPIGSVDYSNQYIIGGKKVNVNFCINGISSSTMVGGKWGQSEDEKYMIDNFDVHNKRFYILQREWGQAGNFLYGKLQGHVCYFFTPLTGEHFAFCKF